MEAVGLGLGALSSRGETHGMVFCGGEMVSDPALVVSRVALVVVVCLDVSCVVCVDELSGKSKMGVGVVGVVVCWT